MRYADLQPGDLYRVPFGGHMHLVLRVNRGSIWGVNLTTLTKGVVIYFPLEHSIISAEAEVFRNGVQLV